MAKLTQCKDCGHNISKNANSCPNCGAKNKRTSILTWLVLIFIGIPILMAIFGGASDPETPATAPLSATSTDDNELDPVTMEPNKNWDYSESVDNMRDSTTYFASNISQNSIDIGFPYNGGSQLSITLRHKADEGNEVLIITNNGQLWCEYNDCKMSVKFDDEPIKQYTLSEAAAGASETMFVENTNDFIDKLKAAERTAIEIGFYDNGQQQFNFDTSALNWPH